MSRDSQTPPRFELDRRWLLRAGIAIVAIGAIVLVARVSSMVFGGGNQRLDRYERASETTDRPAGAPSAKPPTPQSR